MPRNKRLQDRDEKCEAIIACARRLFLEAGYDATSMSRLAAAAGVAANTIYWYFHDKDEVLVAVLNAEMADIWNNYLNIALATPAERLFWISSELQRANRLVSTVHARLQVSEPINQWHNRFHAAMESLALLQLEAAGIAAERRAALLKIWVFSVEGMLAHPMTDEERRAICATLVSC
jgi:AcrR family transcriptional regulator